MALMETDEQILDALETLHSRIKKRFAVSEDTVDEAKLFSWGGAGGIGGVKLVLEGANDNPLCTVSKELFTKMVKWGVENGFAEKSPWHERIVDFIGVDFNGAVVRGDKPSGQNGMYKVVVDHHNGREALEAEIEFEFCKVYEMSAESILALSDKFDVRISKGVGIVDKHILLDKKGNQFS